MTTTAIHLLPKKEFENLAGMQSAFSISIYLPMDLKGKEQNRHLAQARLRQCVKEITRRLDERDMSAGEITRFLQPVKALLTDVELWRNPAAALAIFLSPVMPMRYYLIPIDVQQQTHVDTRFCLYPLLPLFESDGRYYLLELSRDYVKLFEVTRFRIKELQMGDETPKQLEDAVGFDFEQKNLQFRTGQSAQGANFHGQGQGKDDKKGELITFFRKIDAGVSKHINGRDTPLVLSCVDELVPQYKQVNTCPNLYENHISGDPEFKNDAQRIQESWELINPYFKKAKDEKYNQFREQYKKALTTLKDIVPAANNGKVDTLFIAQGTAVYGSYNKEKNSVTVADKGVVGSTSLTNMAAMNTYLQGGKVYFLPQEEMPEQKTSMIALLRY